MTFDQFTPKKWDDAKIRDTARKVKFIRDVEMQKRHHYLALPPFEIPSKLAIKTKDGKEYSAEVDHPKGLPENPLTSEEFVEKFRMQACMNLHESKVKKIISTVMNLEELDNVSELVRLLY